ncbi:MAG TPA: hypothetical protein VKC54_01395 [Patescibacteria group bacterium]|nr:hypothetical protein [Patescibacteria group bacterium]
MSKNDTVLLSLKDLGVKLDVSQYGLGSSSIYPDITAKLKRTKIEFNTDGKELLEFVAKESNKRGRTMTIFHNNEGELIGIGFHTEMEIPGDIDWEDVFVRPSGELARLYGAVVNSGFDENEGIKAITSKQFKRAFEYFLKYGSDDKEKRNNSGEALRHLRGER